MKGHRFIKVGSMLLVSVLLAGSAWAQTKAKSEDEIGLRQETTLYDETKAMPAHGEYGKAEAGKSKPLGTLSSSPTNCA